MNKLTAQYCLNQAEKLAASGSPDDLQQATEFYMKAYKIAQSKGRHERMAEAGQGIGHILRLRFNESLTLDMKLSLCLSMAWRIASTMDIINLRKILRKEKQKELHSDMAFCADTFFELTSPLQNLLQNHSLRSFMTAISNAQGIENPFYRKTALKCFKKYLLLHERGISEYLHVNDFRNALFLINEANFSKSLVLHLAKGTQEYFEAQKIVKKFDSFEKQANGLSNISKAEEFLQGINIDLPDFVDHALSALDFIANAKHQSQGENPLVYMKATLLEGITFCEIISNKIKAKICFEDVMKVGSNNKLTNCKDYKEAEINLQTLKKAEEKSKEETVSREAHIQSLKREMNQLKHASTNLTDEQFVNFLLESFPPKHREKYDQLTIQGANTKKRVYMRLSTYYHPDKVSKKHGERYKILCEEIAKIVNGKYVCM